MTPIANYDIYTTEMTKAIMDKMFFMDKIDSDIIVDFGCADGVLICQLARLFPETDYIGYDNDPKMVQTAKDNWHNSITRGWPTATFTADWDVAKAIMQAGRFNGNKATLVLSSIIHEVYSYCDETEIAQFWDRVYNSGFDHIVIRDMTWANWQLGTRARFDNMCDLVRAKANAKMLEDFENIWGSITTPKNLIHFLLKYRYEINWERELRENYLPLYITDLLATIPEDKYRVTFEDVFSVPFIAKQVQNDFDITFDAKTHVKLILEKI